MRTINLRDKLQSLRGHWAPGTVAEFNGHDVMVVRVEGAFDWHVHDDTDDFFLVLKGRVRIETREGSVRLDEGELCVIPRGIEHRPVADAEAHLLLIERSGTPNTGNAATAAPRRLV